MRKTKKRNIRIITVAVIIVVIIVSSTILAMIFLPYFLKSEIIVTRPDSSDVCNCLGSYKIRWNASDSITKVRIELYNGSKYVEDINEKTNNDGTYTWSIREDHFWYTNGTQYRIKISDFHNENIYDYSDHFEISIDYSIDDDG